MEREGQPHEREGTRALKEGQEKDTTEKCDYIRNPHISGLREDILYHLALGNGSHDLRKMFSDVKYVCMGGTPRRMEAMARYLKEELKVQLPTGSDICDISHRSYRYSLYKVGNVIAVSHGMGIPSMTILLHEVIKLIHYAKCKDVTFIRVGTCGGIGVPGGVVVVSNATLDSRLKPELKLHVLGKAVKRPAILDQDLADELYHLSQRELPQYKTIIGKTICTNDFFEGQGRLDGAFCEFTASEKMSWLNKLAKLGVTNIEMESLGFAAICHHAGIKGAVVCVTLLDRLKGDQLTESKDTLDRWQHRPQELVVKFITKREMK